MLKEHILTPRAALCFAAVLAAVAAAPAPARAEKLIRLQWDGLSAVIGKTVSIPMAGGVVSGKATALEPDALVIDVRRTTDPQAYPKGPLRVPRAALRRFEMRTKGKAYRILFTSLGSVFGLVGGAFAGWSIDRWGENNSQAGAAVIGIWAAGTVGGYLLGNVGDKHWTPVEITP